MILTCTRSRAEHTADRSDERPDVTSNLTFDTILFVSTPNRLRDVWLGRRQDASENHPFGPAPLARVYNTHL